MTGSNIENNPTPLAQALLEASAAKAEYVEKQLADAIDKKRCYAIRRTWRNTGRQIILAAYPSYATAEQYCNMYQRDDSDADYMIIELPFIV